MNFKRNKIYRRFAYSPLVVVLLTFVLIFVSKAVWSAYQKFTLASSTLQESQNEYMALTARNEFLNSEISKLETERGQESVLRERYSVAKEGEKMVIIVDDKNSSVTKPVDEVGIWKKFLNLFK